MEDLAAEIIEILKEMSEHYHHDRKCVKEVHYEDVAEEIKVLVDSKLRNINKAAYKRGYQTACDALTLLNKRAQELN